MKVLHLIGHYPNWNYDSHYKNSIGDGFVFCAYSFSPDYFSKNKVNGYDMSDILGKSFLDLQYFGKKESGSIGKGKLSEYHFHPAAIESDDNLTSVYLINSIIDGIEYQKSLGLKNIIIPNYYEDDNLDKFIGIILTVNNWLKDNKEQGYTYYLSLPLNHHTLLDSEKVERLLYNLTDIKIAFDGYYIVPESKPETRTKLNTDYKYLKNLSVIFKTLKKQKFLTVFAYANWDAIIVLAVTDIDYITIATFENMRIFNIKRFLVSESGGPSKGWYFSEKLLNMVKAQQLNLVFEQGGVMNIRNEKNIFSDVILQEGYVWSNQKPDVHKNYLLSIERLIKKIASIDDVPSRKEYVIKIVTDAIDAYNDIEKKGIYLTDESKNYHLETWRSHLLRMT